ncbi:hypothetical protein MASR2M70_21370 [Bacillota bacterium]
MKKQGKTILILMLMLMTALLVVAPMSGCGGSSETDPPSDTQGITGDGAETGDGEDGDSTQGEASDNKGSPNKATTNGGETKDLPESQVPAQKSDNERESFKVTFSINCSTVFDNLNKIDGAIVETLPKDGWIYPAKEVEFAEGESVFDILLRVTREGKIHMESNSNPALKSKYVEGIHNLYEFDAGELSGWTYKINGKGMGYGSSSSYPEDGDKIEWLYTCDQGRDVGVVP